MLTYCGAAGVLRSLQLFPVSQVPLTGEVQVTIDVAGVADAPGAMVNVAESSVWVFEFGRRSEY